MIQPWDTSKANVDALTEATPNAATLTRSAFYLGVLLECADRLSVEEFAECISRAQLKDAELNTRLEAR